MSENSSNGVERELREKLRESDFKVDDLSIQLKIINKQIIEKDRHVEELTATIQQLRDKAFQTIDLCDYDALKEELDSTKSSLEKCRNEKNCFKTRLNTELEDIELLHGKLDKQNNQMNEMRKTIGDKQKLIDSQQQINHDLALYKDKYEECAKLLDNANSRVSELTNLVEMCREEHLKSNINDSNISFDGSFNGSMPKMFAFNVSSSGESLGVITDIKLSEVERALREKSALLEHKNNEIERLDKELSQYKAMHQNSSETLLEVEKAFEEKLIEYNRLSGLYEEIQSQISDLNRQTDQKIDDLTENVLIFEQKIDELTKDCIQIENERQYLSQQNDKILSENELYKQNIEEFIEIVDKKESIINSLNALLEKNALQIDEKEIVINQMSTENNHLKENMKKLEYDSSNNLKQKTLECNKLEKELIEYNRLSGLYDEMQSRMSDLNRQTDQKIDDLTENVLIFEQKIDELTKNCIQIENERQYLSQQNDKILSENELYKQNIEEFIEIVDKKESIINSLNALLEKNALQIDEKEIVINQMSTENNHLKENMKKLEYDSSNNLKQKTLECNKLEKELIEYNRLSGLYDEMQSRMSDLNRQTDQKIDDLTENVLIFEQKIDELTKNCIQIENERQYLLQQNNKILSENELYKQNIEEFVEIVDKKESIINSLNALLEKNALQIDEKDIVINQMLTEINHLKENIKKLEYDSSNNLRQKTLECNKLDKELSQYKAMHQNSSETLLEVEKAFEEKLMEYNRLSGLYEEIQSRVTDLNRQTNQKIDDLTENVLIFEKKIDELTKDCIQIENERQYLSQQNNEILNENERYKQNIEEFVEIVDKKESTINSLNALLEKNALQIDEKEIVINQMSTEINKMSTENNHLKENIKKLEYDSSNNLKQKTLECNKLEKEVNEYKMISEKSTEELINMQSLIDDRVNQFKSKITKLNEQLILKQQQCDQLENNGKQSDLDLRQYENYLKQYQRQINELTKKLDIEEESFKMERNQKERYANENIKLEQELSRYKLLLESKSSNNVFVMPTTVNITTNASDRVVVTNDDPNAANFTNISNQSLNNSRKLPFGTGNRFIMADEEGEFMNPNNLMSLKNGECDIEYSYECDAQRMSTLQRRNTLLPLHLRTSYPVELAYCRDTTLDENTVRSGISYSLPFKSIENTATRNNQSVSFRNDANISCENINYRKYKNSTHIISDENARKSGSRIGLRSLTPQKIKKFMNKQKWTPNKSKKV